MFRSGQVNGSKVYSLKYTHSEDRLLEITNIVVKVEREHFEKL